MSRPYFLVDEDFKYEIVRGVRRRDPAAGFLSVRDAGLSGRPDPDILAYAAAHGLIILSHDTRTMTKHAYDRLAAGAEMAGLLLVRQRTPIGLVIESLVVISGASDAEEWHGSVVFLPI